MLLIHTRKINQFYFKLLDDKCYKNISDDLVNCCAIYVRELPIRVKRPMSDVPIFRQKNSNVRFWCLVVSRIRMQLWHVNSLGTVLRTPYSHAHKTLSRHQSHHVTDDAGHQTWLLMLAISRWSRVW